MWRNVRIKLLFQETCTGNTEESSFWNSTSFLCVLLWLFHVRAAPCLMLHYSLYHACDFRENRAAAYADHHDQANDFHSSGSSIVWLAGWNGVKCSRFVATCLYLPWWGRLTEVVEKAGRHLLLKVSQELTASESRPLSTGKHKTWTSSKRMTGNTTTLNKSGNRYFDIAAWEFDPRWYNTLCLKQTKK